MKKICLIIALMASNQASAGFWDSVTGFFSGSDSAEALVKEEAVQQQSGADAPQMLGLVDTLVKSLNVSEGQATGGIGAIFSQAKSTLPTEKFGMFEQYVPNLDTLLAAAPALTSGGEGLTGMLNKDSLKGSANMLASASQMVQQFTALGLSPEMIGQFVDIATGFLKQSGGTDVAGLLTTGLSGLL